MSIERVAKNFDHELVKVEQDAGEVAAANAALTTLLERTQTLRDRLSVSTRFYLAPFAEGQSRSPYAAQLREMGFRPLCWTVLRRWYGGEHGEIGSEIWLGPRGEITVDVSAPTTEWEHASGVTIPSVQFTDGHRLVLWPADHLAPTPGATDLFATGDFEADMADFSELLEQLRADGRVPIRVTNLAAVRRLQELEAARIGTDPMGLALIVILIVVMVITSLVFGTSAVLTPAWLVIPVVILWRMLGLKKPRPAPHASKKLEGPA